MDEIYDDAMNSRQELFIQMEPISHGHGKGDDKLTVWHQRQDIIEEMGPSLRHALGAAEWTKTLFFATKRHHMLTHHHHVL